MMLTNTINRIRELASRAIAFRHSWRCVDAPVHLSKAGALMKVGGVSQLPYRGPIYEDDLGRGPLGVSYASGERPSSFA